MCEIEKGPETFEGGHDTSGPMRHPDKASDIIGGAGCPASQPVRLDEVCVRVLRRLIIRRASEHFTNT
ncbi:MAG: hypothetical protein ACR2OV_00010 [Hyphomicrobiaceae bacterium]